jgi:hypothetical protein
MFERQQRAFLATKRRLARRYRGVAPGGNFRHIAQKPHGDIVRMTRRARRRKSEGDWSVCLIERAWDQDEVSWEWASGRLAELGFRISGAYNCSAFALSSACTRQFVGRRLTLRTCTIFWIVSSCQSGGMLLVEFWKTWTASRA